MGEPVDTSAEAVERLCDQLESVCARPHTGFNRQAQCAEAAALLRAIAKERDELQLAHTEAAAHYAARVAELEAQCARVQRDADRYAWLRQFYNVPEESRSGMHNIRAVAGYDEVLAEAELDAAIDAAMAAKEAG